ncbi:MAG: transposase [Usitatibacter sp.]
MHMARTPRLFVPGYPSHVVHRGNNRQNIFHCAADYRVFLEFLKEAAGEFEIAVNSYVLMTNHVHLLLTPNERSAISKALHSASRRYAGYFNHRYERTGTLWEGRFHASLVTTDHYLLGCHRYIDLNPVRAGLVDAPSQYFWSSHRFYAIGEPDSVVTPHRAVEGLGRDDAGRRLGYLALFEMPLEPADIEAIRRASLAGAPIGARSPARGRPRKCVPDTIY